MPRVVSTLSLPRQPSVVGLYTGFVDLASRVPLSLPQLATRLAVGLVFWNSAQTKLASWPITVQLFAFEYQVPVLPPELAARLATTAELAGAITLFSGVVHQARRAGAARRDGGDPALRVSRPLG